jgi:hypothetical protein
MTNTETERNESGRLGLLEILVALALAGVLVLVTLPWLFASLHRARLSRAARDTRELIELSRLQARKLGLRTHVVVDETGRRLVAFVDVDLDGVYDLDGDYPVGPALELPKAIELRAPGEGTVLGPHAVVGFEPPVAGAARGPVFLADGSLWRAGAFRFADSRGNFLEVRLAGEPEAPATVRKWAGGSDPEGAWFESGEGGRPWRWE